MALGNLSFLGPEIGDVHDFKDNTDTMCTAYGRDRGDEDQEATEWIDANDWYCDFGMGAQHFYLLQPDGTWMWRDSYNKAGRWTPVADYLAKKKLIVQQTQLTAQAQDTNLDTARNVPS